MGRIVSTREAVRNLTKLLKEVREGVEVTITSRGKPVAVLVPFERYRRLSREEALERLLSLADEHLEGLSLEETYGTSREELEGRVKRSVIDASALMVALLPGEPLKEKARDILGSYVKGEIELWAPSLLLYEVANSLLKAERRKGGGVSPKAIDAILGEIEGLETQLVDVPPVQVVMVARKYGTMRATSP